MKIETLQKLEEIIDAPEFILPWLDRFYEPCEIEILVRLGSKPFPFKKFTEDLEISPEETDRLLRRGVLMQPEASVVAPADFHTRYDIWALFEGFKDIPDRVRSELNQWELSNYIENHIHDIETLKSGRKADPDRIIPRYLLLEECVDILNEADRLYLWPCNCRSMINGCKKPVYTCIRFDNSQGQGYEISREKALQIIHDANKKGLMQSGELGRNNAGKLAGAICNCCTDCCFPHLLAQRCQAEKLWPVSRYRAVLKMEDCTVCGKCASRCPFDAFTYDKTKTKQDRLSFDPDRCRGCGLCAVTCQGKAIHMEKLQRIDSML